MWAMLSTRSEQKDRFLVPQTVQVSPPFYILVGRSEKAREGCSADEWDLNLVRQFGAVGLAIGWRTLGRRSS